MRVKLTRSLIPNLFTIMNMFCGFLSIINTFEGNFIYASILIIIAAIFDMLDGLAARITKSASEFGVELDSLSDLVSFGTAPAILIYKINLYEYYEIGILASAFFLICGALRLARFNVQLVGFDKKFFYGLPIPTSAITLSAYILTFYSDVKFKYPFGDLLLPLAVLLGFLMISKIKYNALPKISIQGLKEHPIYFGFIILSLILAIVTEGKAIFFLVCVFIFTGIVKALLSLLGIFHFDKTKNNEKEILDI
ncbi:MAG: CDP-diacylglycerol--serine O-phosphatidyltransferase [Ignavibacteria bacterium]|nr:CDP-diacylglycerol--serine O-phosphatidyltransferase [Ignavibacteria bacterium]